MRNAGGDWALDAPRHASACWSVPARAKLLRAPVPSALPQLRQPPTLPLRPYRTSQCLAAAPCANQAASRYRGQICSRRLLGFGATPCRLVSLIHTSAGPYDRARDVRNASDMKVNRMSLALAALGQRAAMASELAGFGRNFRAGMHSMVTNSLAFKSWRL